MKYRTNGISKNKEIKKQRKKPVPLQLMRKENATAQRLGANTARDGKDIMFS